MENLKSVYQSSIKVISKLPVYYRLYKLMMHTKRNRKQFEYEFRNIRHLKHMDAQNDVYKTPDITHINGLKINMELYGKVLVAKQNRLYKPL